MLPEEVKFLMQMYDSLSVASALEDKSPYKRKIEYKKKIVKLLEDEQISKEAYEIICRIYGIKNSVLDSKTTHKKISDSASKVDPCGTLLSYSGRRNGGC